MNEIVSNFSVLHPAPLKNVLFIVLLSSIRLPIEIKKLVVKSERIERPKLTLCMYDILVSLE